MADRRTDPIDPSRPPGVNVIGYHCTTSGVGMIARWVTTALRAAGVPTNAIDIEPTWSPRRGDPEPYDTLYDTTILVATAERNEQLRELFGEIIAGSKLVIGHWSWELPVAPPEHLPAIAAVDQIWASTSFMTDSYAALTDKPCCVLPPRFPEPQLVAERRARIGPITFLVMFDHLSVIERKNPFAAITAFQRAMDGDSLPAARLIIKTLNGDVLPESAQRLAEAVGDDPRIEIRDVHLTDEENAQLLADADVMVSLHRSEGVGLHLAEAMWLGLPVLASRFGGNTEFMDDACAALVDVTLTSVGEGVRSYPADGTWGEPDLDHATEWMRRLCASDTLRRRIGGAGQTKMRNQPTDQQRGAAMWEQIQHSNSPEPRSPLRSFARRLGAPARNYINQHFEMTKQEVREQVASLRGAADHNESVDRLAEVTAETSLHQMQSLAKLRSELADVRAELTETRQAVDALAAVVADLAEVIARSGADR